MKRYSAMFLASMLVVAACDSKSEGKKDDKQANADKAKEAAKKPEAKKAEEPKKPEAKKAEDTKPEGALAKSGIPVGGKMKAFDIINCESGDTYCQVCKYGSSPKIMAVGTADDPKFKEDLKAIEALVAKMGKDEKGENKLKAFALIGEKKGDQFLPPAAADVEAAKAKAKALKEELKLTMPVVIAADETKGKKNTTFTKHYKITESRTVMFADGENEVKYSEVGPENMAELEKIVQSTIG